MAKPDCDDGWYKKSIELEAALEFADFTKVARTLLRYVFAQIFGQGRRPRYAVLRCPEIADRIGKHRQDVYRALDELVKSRALIPVTGKINTFQLVMDYEKWTLVGRVKSRYLSTDLPRLNAKEVEDCMRAVAYSKSFQLSKDADPCVTDPADTATPVVTDPADTGCQLPSCQVVTDPADNLSATYLTKSPPPMYPPVGMESESREEELPTKETLGSTATEGESDAASLAPRLVPIFDRLDAWVKAKLAAHDYDEQELAKASRLCRGWISCELDPEWCASAFQAAVDDPNILGKADYARGILRRMYLEAKEGQPVLLPAFCDFKADPSAPPLAVARRRGRETTTNLPSPEQAAEAKAARHAEEARAAARRSRWEALDARQRAALMKEWESTHPIARALPRSLQDAQKRTWCEEAAEQRGLA